MVAFIVGIITGFFMCIPVGPLTVLTVNTKLRSGTLPAFLIALGGSLMDLTYFLVIMAGLSFIDFDPKVVSILKSGGIVLILVLGIKELFAKPNMKEPESKKISGANYGGFLLLGIVIYVSNPTLIVTMSGLGAFLKSLALFDDIFINNVFLSVGVAIGSASWFLFVITLVGKYEEVIKQRFLPIFNKACGAMMVSFSIYMGIKLTMV
ncbi:MAG: LysE family transporter [Bacteriovoracaceae bacterium]|jgi:threonine/homoserine/homoserine lactone efflux protein|nr:LysE family transporter [Bacteriovoracaceae bacterium]